MPVNQTRENLAVWRYMEVIGVVKKGNRVGENCARVSKAPSVSQKVLQQKYLCWLVNQGQVHKTVLPRSCFAFAIRKQGIDTTSGGSFFALLARRTLDRLHGQRRLPFGNHDSQIAVTLGTGALEVLGHEASSGMSWAAGSRC